MPTQELPQRIKDALSNESHGSQIQPTPKWIQLTCMDGQRTLVTCYPYDVRREGEFVIAKVQLFGRDYYCRMQEKMPSYRLCDKNGKLIHDRFPELPRPPKKVWDNEEFFVAPWSWDKHHDTTLESE